MDILTIILAGLLSFVSGMLIWTVWQGQRLRAPSGERAYKRMLRYAKRARLRFSEVRRVYDTTDLPQGGDRLMPLLVCIRDEELTLEQSTEVLDRLRKKLAEGEALPEYVDGEPRSLLGTDDGLDRERRGDEVVPLAELDRRTMQRFPIEPQPSEHALPENATPEARQRAIERERAKDEAFVERARRQGIRMVDDEEAS